MYILPYWPTQLYEDTLCVTERTCLWSRCESTRSVHDAAVFASMADSSFIRPFNSVLLLLTRRAARPPFTFNQFTELNLAKKLLFSVRPLCYIPYEACMRHVYNKYVSKNSIVSWVPVIVRFVFLYCILTSFFLLFIILFRTSSTSIQYK